MPKSVASLTSTSVPPPSTNALMFRTPASVMPPAYCGGTLPTL